MFEPTSGIAPIAPFSVGESISGCINPTYYVIISMRNADFGGKDSMVDDRDSVLIAYHNNNTFYQLSNLDTTILYTGDPSDSIYTHAFDTLTTNNIGKINEVMNLIDDRNKTPAQDSIDVIDPINTPETNLTKVLGIYLKFLNETIDDSDVELLQEIAYQHPFYGGNAVYIARSLLNLKIIDYLPEARKGGSISAAKLEEHTSNKFSRIYPNPTSDYVTIEVIHPEEKSHYQITLYDITGRKVQGLKSSAPITTIPLSGVQPGSYIIEIKDNQSLKEFHKLEIIH